MIVFMSFIRAVYDRDLLPAWTAHYLSFKFDRYVVFLHDVPGEEIFTDATRHHLEDQGFETGLVRGEYHNGALQSETLHDFKLTLNNDDFLVVADSDEFHAMTDYRRKIMDHEMIYGRMVDRWSLDGLIAADPRRNPNHQYPRTDDLWKHLVDQGRLSKNAMLPLPDHKFLAFRSCYNVNMNGCHTFSGYAVPDEKHILKDQAINHYTWRKGILKRLAGKTYFTAKHLVALGEYFNISPADEEIEIVSLMMKERYEKTNAMVMQL